jgi:hypothetical protein
VAKTADRARKRTALTYGTSQGSYLEERDKKIKTVVNHLKAQGPTSQIQLATELFTNLSMATCELGLFLDTVSLVEFVDGKWRAKDVDT